MALDSYSLPDPQRGSTRPAGRTGKRWYRQPLVTLGTLLLVPWLGLVAIWLLQRWPRWTKAIATAAGLLWAIVWSLLLASSIRSATVARGTLNLSDADLQAYSEAVGGPLDSFESAMDVFTRQNSQLGNNLGLAQDPAWKATTAQALSQMSAAAQQLAAAQLPADMQPISAEYQDISRETSAMTTSYSSAMEAGDTSSMNAALSHIHTISMDSAKIGAMIGDR